MLTLVKAVEKLENNIPLIILGTGPIEDEIKEYIKAHNLGNRIKALGFKSGDELKSMLQKRNASFFPVSGTKTALYNYGSNVTGKTCYRNKLRRTS